jgi:PEP-CTERM motif-containing protein
MRRVVLLALLALALPTAAVATTFDFIVGANGSTMSLTPTSATITNATVDILTINNGAQVAATGTISISFPSFNTTTSGSFGAGGSITLNAVSGSNTYLFTGTFTSGSWIVNTSPAGTAFTFSSNAMGSLSVNGGPSILTSFVLVSGNTDAGSCASGTCTVGWPSGDVEIGTVPEPSTLGLLGTGLLGLAGMVRRKIRG